MDKLRYDEKGNILLEALIFLFVTLCVIQVIVMIAQVDLKIWKVLERKYFHNEEIQELYFTPSS